MTPSAKAGIVGAIVGLILIIILPTWLIWIGIGLVVAALAIPVGAYLALDKSQRRRLRAIRSRQRG